MQEFQFEDGWDTNTSISRWNIDRGQLNDVINAYNRWQVNGFNVAQVPVILASIELGRQTYAKDDSPDSYGATLNRMREFILTKYPQFKQGVYTCADNDGS